jgi:hypothetical protein
MTIATVHLTRYFGLTMQRGPGADGRQYLYGVAWFPRARNRLGYWYFSLRVR